MLIQEMLFDGLYYVLIYITLFISVFWFMIFFEKKDDLPKDPARPKRMPSISMIIPAYNEEEGISATIDSVLNQDYPKGKLKIFVVDDASKDRTAEIVKGYEKRFGNVKLLRHRMNKRKAAALNTAMKYIDTDLVAFLDGDSELDREALLKCVGYFENGKTGSVIGTIVPKSNRTFSQKLQRVEYAFTAIVRKMLTFLGALYITPAFAVYRTDIVRNLGGWDEDNFTEDLEMGLRLQKNGYKVENSLNAFVRTTTPNNLRMFWNQRIRWYRGFIYNSKKYANMFFGKDFGHLGWFILPIQYILIAITIPVFAYAFMLFLKDTMINLTNFSLIGFDLSYMITHALRFNLDYFNVILFVVTLTGLAILINIGSKHSRQNLSKLEYIMYIPLYPMINALLWIFVFYYELTGRECKW